ncbi:MAG TPA: cytochrome c-type biogenesis CcmF C-terminal domain-containing protein [Myxococcaceae bacterium]|nr:cytochrome c-type biogenesis CcmF C-terminal domain-containing protein [Myxococcaceae bacterium]
MSSTVGTVLVLGGLLAAAFGAVVGIEGGLRHRAGALKVVLATVTAFLVCMVGANLTMVYALVTHDFSVHYVSQVGSRATPLVYTVVSLWSALEGSILFWGAILAVYVFAFARAHRNDPPTNPLLALGTMLAVGVFFSFLIAGPANPFGRVTPVPPDGPGPNPLLQNHVLMVVHPPMLYLGYVGMVVPFGIAVAALLRGQLGDAWMSVLRRWTLIPWTFLSVGIVLGSWWAYAVLGWGGYWAWDPVENASFLPWLTSTAFLHSAMVQERRHTLKLWTVSLSLGSFLLTILGTFMTRSGVFNSVHSFTQSEIGPTFLVFLGAVLVVSIVLIAVRGPLLVPEGALGGVASRESAILLNNLLFAALTFTVLLGTVFPLVREAFSGVRISVGAPYFNRMAVPLGVAILFLMGVGPSLPWGTASKDTVRRQFLVPAAVGVAVVLASVLAGLRGGLTLLTFGLAGFAATVTLREMVLPVRVRMREQGEALPLAVWRTATRARRRFGGYVVHLAVVLVFVAIAASQSYVVHTTATLTTGQSFRLGPYAVQLAGLRNGVDPHRRWTAAEVDVTDGQGRHHLLAPRMNFYERSTDPIGSPAIRSAAFEDFYLTLLAFDAATPSASFNAWIFPMVSWIWWSLPLFVLGALFAAWPERRRARAGAAEPLSVPTKARSPGAAA